MVSRGISRTEMPREGRIERIIPLYCAVSGSEGSLPTKRTVAPRTGATFLAKKSRSSAICTDAASDGSLRKYAGKTLREITPKPPGRTSTLARPAQPLRTISSRPSKENSDASSSTTSTYSFSTIRDAFSTRYLCPSVKGFAFITMAPACAPSDPNGASPPHGEDGSASAPKPNRGGKEVRRTVGVFPTNEGVAAASWKPRLSKTARLEALV